MGDRENRLVEKLRTTAGAAAPSTRRVAVARVWSVIRWSPATPDGTVSVYFNIFAYIEYGDSAREQAQGALTPMWSGELA